MSLILVRDCKACVLRNQKIRRLVIVEAYYRPHLVGVKP